MKKFIIAILILAILAGGGYGVYHFYFEKKADSAERVSSDAENAVYVDQVSAITGFGVGNGLIERFGGEVSPQATLEVKLEGDRKVKECYVKEGDEVKEGQRLFTYDTREDEDKLAQAEIDIEKAQGDIELAEQSIQQLEKDKKEASADDQLMITTSILSAQNEIKQYEYDIKSRQLEMDQLKSTIDNATVTAEMGGIIQKINDSGESSSDYYGYGSGSDSAYITILAIGDFRIKGSANEQNLDQIQEGMSMLVHSRVDDTQTWTGIVSEIDLDNAEEEEGNNYYYGMDSDSGSSNYKFYVELDDSTGLILGQHVYMEEDRGQEEKTGMWLEEYYIMQEDDGAYVWMANKSNVIEKHEITLGEYDEDLMKYEVLDGLAPEDYIAYPMDSVTEGVPVIYNDIAAGDDMGMDDMSMDDMSMDDMDMEDMEMYDMSMDDMDMDDISLDDMDMEDIDMDDMSMDDMDMDVG